MQVVVLVLGLAAGLAGSASANLYPEWSTWWRSDPFTVCPRVDPTGWNETPKGGTNPIAIAPRGEIWIVMDNFWRPGWLKEGYFKLTSETTGWLAGAVTDHGRGYNPGDQPGEPIPGEPYPIDKWWVGPGDPLEYWFRLYPQPSCEWIKLTNNTTENVFITDVHGYSRCTPEPSLGLLLLLGVVPVGILCRRRRLLQT